MYQKAVIGPVVNFYFLSKVIAVKMTHLHNTNGKIMYQMNMKNSKVRMDKLTHT